MSFEPSWLLEHLAVGGHFTSEQIEALARIHRIAHVVDLRIEQRDDEIELRRHGITWLHLPTEDNCAVSRAMLDEGVAWVTAHLAEGRCVYIHCQHGIGRSILLSLCVLVALGEEPLEALRRTKSVRACTSPSPPQLHAFVDWCRARREEHGASFSVPTWDALAAVAYGHEPPRNEAR
jgi:protein-tyrosine phosphatase